eukprot:TRINITY_DN19302_c0_g1_i6.p1 TRINITY_DN19302_c0_g1~~TRINITY_DN19302_c0_g1_i6.p1  ORF type:complete len:243 (+),score=49.20 TRINITY_DN19302_c0_g1_i6:152-880(+)
MNRLVRVALGATRALPLRTGAAQPRVCFPRFNSGMANLDPTNTEFESHERHLLTALVTNEPGTLAHIAGTLAARGYNIDSLVVGRTEIPDLSRVTIVVEGSKLVMNQVQTQLEDLVCVVVTERLSFNALHDRSFVERDFMMIKVKTPKDGDTTSVLEMAKVFNASVLDFADTQILLSLSGVPAKIERFISLCDNFGIVELARTGVVAMQRGDHGLSNLIADGQLVDPFEKSKMESSEDLPPG